MLPFNRLDRVRPRNPPRHPDADRAAAPASRAGVDGEKEPRSRGPPTVSAIRNERCVVVAANAVPHRLRSRVRPAYRSVRGYVPSRRAPGRNVMRQSNAPHRLGIPHLALAALLALALGG